MVSKKTKKKLSRGARKHIRRQKARIRRDFHDASEREKQIQELYRRFGKSSETELDKK